MEVEVRFCKNSDKSKLPAQLEVGLCNNILGSMFADCDFKVGRRSIVGCHEYYGVKSYLHNLLNFNAEAKDTWMETSGWTKDIADAFNYFGKKIDPALLKDHNTYYPNTGYEARKNLFRTPAGDDWLDTSITLLGPMHTDLDSTKTGLINRLGCQITLTQQKPEFYLLCDDPQVDAVLQIISAKIHIKLINIEPKIYDQVIQKLDHTPAIYNYRRIMVTSYPITKGSPKVHFDKIFSGQNPCRAFFFLVETEALEGKVNSNPYSYRCRWPAPRLPNLFMDCPRHKLTDIEYDVLVAEILARRARFESDLASFRGRRDTARQHLARRTELARQNVQLQQRHREFQHRELAQQERQGQQERPRERARSTSPSFSARSGRSMFSRLSDFFLGGPTSTRSATRSQESEVEILTPAEISPEIHPVPPFERQPHPASPLMTPHPASLLMTEDDSVIGSAADLDFFEEEPVSDVSLTLPECNCACATAVTPDPFRVTSMRFKLNGNDFGSISSAEYRMNDVRSQFVNANLCLNLENTNWSTGITYRDFATDSHFLAVDLSASGNSSGTQLAPLVRTGQPTLEISFDKPTSISLDVLVVMEMLSVMTVDKHRAVSLSYA
jgi:hypothetical protein